MTMKQRVLRNKIRDEREQRERKLKRDRADKKANMERQLQWLDCIIKLAIEPDNKAYNEDEIRDLNDARYRLFRVLSGTSMRRR